MRRTKRPGVATKHIVVVIVSEVDGAPIGEERESDEPEDDGEDFEGEDGPAVVEFGEAAGGDMFVGEDYDCCYALFNGMLVFGGGLRGVGRYVR